MDLAARSIFDLGNNVTGIEARVTDLYGAKEVGDRISAALGSRSAWRDWMEVNHNLSPP